MPVASRWRLRRTRPRPIIGAERTASIARQSIGPRSGHGAGDCGGGPARR
jgi:hypothetical protein